MDNITNSFNVFKEPLKTPCKTCTSCREHLPIESFGSYTVKKTQKTYHEPTCRPCFRLRMKKVYLKEKKVKCDCGSDIKQRSYKTHLTSNKHKKYLTSIESFPKALVSDGLLKHSETLEL